MVRQTIAGVFVLVSLSVVAESTPPDPCARTNTSATANEMQTLHQTLMCLHEHIEGLNERIDRLVDAVNRLSIRITPENNYAFGLRYIPTRAELRPERINPYGYNPCESPLTPYSKALCQRNLIDIFGDLCFSGNCGDGLKPLIPYMPDSWRDFMQEIDSSSYRLKIGPWLDEMPTDTKLFRFSDSGQSMLDMSEVFQRVYPSEMFGQPSESGQ